MPAHAETLLTADDLLRINLPDKWTELDRGQLVVREPPGGRHGVASARLTYLLGEFVYRRGLGVLNQDTGFKIASSPDTVRAPDVAYVTQERAAATRIRGYPELAPDLVVEVVSPGDHPSELRTRAGMWLDAGVRLVWIIDPSRATAHVHRPDGSVTLVTIDGALDGEAVLPGFACALTEVLQA